MEPVDILKHYGVARRSGRYPWGSGKDPYQRSGDFLARVNELKSQGLSETEIAQAIGLTTTQLRIQKSLANDERRALEVEQAKGLREKGYSLNEIAVVMGYNSDSSIRSLLNSGSESKMKQAQETANTIRDAIEEKGIIDIGIGVERELGVSREKLQQAVYILEMEGYPVYGRGVSQVTNPSKQTIVQVICPKGTENKDIYSSSNPINSLRDYYSADGGETFNTFRYPASLDSSRVAIRYAEDGGTQKDGVIELRRGVDDISLGDSTYAQVRILVDDTRYLKGMAVYSDDLPDGVDVLFNTNKSNTVSKLDVMKKITNDPDNPFGSLIRVNGQRDYTDENGELQLSVINKRADEGDWSDWSNKLPSQFLSKQNITLINKQLGLAESEKQAEYDEICALTNPTVKKSLLQSFSDDCDSAAIHLQAAALPRQSYQVILPITTMKDNEIYAPNYKNGEQVALVRYPHGGTFEIPVLTVNNKQTEAKAVLGNAIDAVGINSTVAERLSGADFDGDTVMVIPTNSSVKITSTSPLKGLVGFDPKMEYQYDTKVEDADGTVHYYRDGYEFKAMNNTQTEMGKISNLITDMTIIGASDDELTRAVKHSMVVIDAEKHGLDYKRSASENDIASLKKKYQGSIGEDGKYHEGAATLISRAKSETAVIKRRGSGKTDPETGTKVYKESYEEYTDASGKTQVRTQKSTKMAEVSNAYLLSSGTMKEAAYADYANKMKALANDARKEILITGKIAYSASAKEAYASEVSSLKAKLEIALLNAPRERQAQVVANSVITAKKEANPGLTKAEVKKLSQQALTSARNSLGAKRTPIEVTDSEWAAIQAGAISENVLTQIINNINIDTLRALATPRDTTDLSAAKLAKLKSMAASGYTTAEIAESLGISTTTVANYL